uniref:At2g35280-like TPR domain-containing protein n=1 Tax=Lactuca sativa TaxID=4236 RepID=A0A9R1VWR0_LACSA|nr:hypothetical protein LSAT_V11C400214800 [Lactuca sativa]
MLGSESAKDIISTRICSKKMYVVGGDPQVFRIISLHMIEGMGPKHLNAELFICACAVHNNIEAMFRQGAEECLCNGNFDVGMTLLRKATDADQFEAIYFLGMIYISRGTPQYDQGMYGIYVYKYLMHIFVGHLRIMGSIHVLLIMPEIC